MNNKYIKYLVLFTAFLISISTMVNAQENGYFTKLFDQKGVAAYFLFYRTGNGVDDNGITVLLHNKNDYDLNYRFTLIFRADTVESEKEVKGFIKAGEKMTGSTSGLYFIPFQDKRLITELGVKGFKTEPVTGRRNSSAN